MGGRNSYIAVALLTLVMSGCRSSTSAPDAGPPKPTGRVLPPPSPKAPPPPPMTLASAEGCRPYWTLVELDCNAKKISERFPSGTSFCDPGHVRLTRTALTNAELGVTGPNPQALLAGVAWSDDPDGLLEKDPTGLTWCRAFVAARRGGATLLARSQFGDLQFLHGLASKPGETNRAVNDDTGAWLEFTYRVAIGDIAPSTRLKDVPVKRVASLFSRESKRTVAQLFHAKDASETPARAFGSFLHLLQDLVGDGHTIAMDRDAPKTRRVIERHFTTGAGAHPMHRNDTGWRALWEDNATMSTWPQATGTVQHGIDLLRLVAGKQPWPAAQRYLNSVVYSYGRLETPAVASVPAR